MTDVLMAMNAGSSSFKFALAPVANCGNQILSGSAERLGSADGVLRIRTANGSGPDRLLPGISHSEALAILFDSITAHDASLRIRGVGHRIVHGGTLFADPVRITPSVIEDLVGLVPLAPLHQPHGIAAIRATAIRFPEAVQVACFDTAFHADMPWVNRALALPRRFYEEGLRRYGFHGIACQSVCDALNARGFPLAERRIVIAHLGNGCSVTAVREGRSLASSMGFSVLDGLAMGTRCGHIDPGAILHLLRNGYDAEQVERLLYHKSGLLGLSGLSNDMRDLEASDTEEAKDAIAFFIARTVEEICRMAGVMGGLDSVVFSGGIGENSESVRRSILERLSFIADESGRGVASLVQPANEERHLLLASRRLL